MDFSTLKQLAEVYPMLIKPFKGLSDPSDSDITLKINTIVQYLNQIGQVSNDTVNSWNKVMVWTMDEGLTDSVNAKIDDMVAKGTFNDLLTSLTNTLLGSEVLGTVSQDVKGAINEVLGIANANTLALGSEVLATTNKDVKGAINEVKGIADSNTSALAENTSQLSDIAINALHNGIKGDGTDETVAINNLLSIYKNVFFPKPPVSYTISDTINVIGTTNMKDGIKIEFAQGATLKQTANKPALKLTGIGHVIINPPIDVSPLGSGFTSHAILLYSSSASLPSAYHKIKRLNLSQTTKNGIAIGLQAINDGYCYYNNFDGFIGQFKTGIKIEGSSTNGINNNTFNIDVNSSQQIVNSVGGSGNKFCGRCQATTIDPLDTEKACVYVDGSQNDFDLMLYDVGGSGLMKYAYEFSPTSIANTFTHDDVVKNRSTTHYSNTPLVRSERTPQYKKIINMFVGDDQNYNNSYGMASSPDYISEYFERLVGISPESNSLADKRNISSITITPVNATVTTSLTDNMDLFNHNKSNSLIYTPTLTSQPSSLTIDVLLTTPEQIMFTGIIKTPFRSANAIVQCYVKRSSDNTWLSIPSLFGSQIKKTGTSYNEIDKYSYGSDVIFSAESLSYSDYSSINGIRYVLSYPALAATDIAVPSTTTFEVSYLWVNFRRKNANRSNNAYPYIGGDTFTGDVKFSTSAIGPIIKDTTNGHTYRIQVTNGAIVLQQVT